MKTGRIVLFLMVLSILWCADVFAHPIAGKDIVHFCPGTSNDPCEGTTCDVGSDYDGGHGHISKYTDVNENNRYDPGVDDATAWGYWGAGGYAVVRGDAPDIGCGEGNSVTPVFSISVISGPGSGAPGSQLTFVVEVRRDGTAVSGQTVTFSVSPNNGTASLGTTSTTTLSNGRAQTILTLGDSASGSYTITATSNSKSVSRTATVQTSPPPPTYSIHVISGPGSGAPGSQLTFVVEVRRDGTAVSGQTVTFSVSPNNGTASLGTTSTTTLSNGRAQTILTLGDSASGSYTITATSNSKSVSRTATVQTSPPPPTYSIHVISGPGSGAPGSQLTFVVEVRRDGTAVSGQTVTFSVSPNNGTASLGTTSTTTLSNGRAQTILTLGDSASGSYTITATSNSKSVSRTATVTGGGGNLPPVFSIVVISPPGSGAPSSQLTFVVEVREDGAAVSGQTVTFSVSPNNGTASLGTTSTTTLSNGRAQTILTLGDSASGSYTITATSNSKSVSRTATVQTSPPPPTYSIHVISGPGSGAPGSQLTFVVEVRRDGTAVSGQTVTFSVSPNNGTASLGTTSTTTLSNGRAQTILTLGDSASGSYTITATSNSKSVSRTATVTGGGGNLPPVFSIVVISPPGSGAPSSQLTFVVEVREDGAAVSGQTVTFSVSPNNGTASLGTTSTTTLSNGRAQTILTLGDSASGSYTITATSNSKSVNATATVQTSPPPPPPPPPSTFSINVVSSPGSGEPGDTLTFAVEVLQDGSLTQGLTVAFSVSPNNGTALLSPTSTTTDSNGQAQTILTLGDSASGSYTITATSNGVSVSGTATVEDSLILPTPSFSIRVVTSPGSGAPGDTLTFAVEVQQDRTLTEGLTVDFSITSGDENASLGSTSETTGSNGRAQTTLILGSNASGSYTITATSNNVSVSRTATVQTSPPPPPPPPPSTFSINVVSSPGSGEPGDTLTFAVEVLQDGTLTQGLTVDFSITSGDGNASLGSASETTGSNGQVQTTLILSSSASGSYTITATSNGVSVSGTATVEDSLILPTPAFSIRVVTSPGSGEPGDTLTFAVEVQQDGTLTQGLTVTFSVSPNNGTASLSPTSTTTDSNGQADTTLTLGNSASGAYTITATSNGVSVSATATVEDSLILPTPAFSIRVVTSPGSGEPGDTLTFAVEVQQDGTLTQGLTVDFSITSGDENATLNTTSTTTDSNGQAQTTLTLGNSASGAYTITATSNGVSVSGTATVETEDDNNGNGNGNGGNNQEPDIPQRTDPESDEGPPLCVSAISRCRLELCSYPP